MGLIDKISSLFSTISGNIYTPPKVSAGVVKGVPFKLASRVGTKYSERFSRWDAREERTKPEDKRDKNNCKGVYRFPDNTLFWEAKMALDTDGATSPAAVGADPDTHSSKTSYKFSGRESVNSEIVPYVVVPTYDDPGEATGRPDFEHSGDNFVSEFGLAYGTLGVIIFRDKIAGVIFADEGPPAKIGEASIRAHELVRTAPRPWADKEKSALINSGEDGGVLYFLFSGQTMDIDRFGPDGQAQLADAIEREAMALFNTRFKS